MDFTLILSALRQGYEFAKTLVPQAVQIGGSTVETAVNAVAAVSEVAANIQKRIEEGKIVADATDQARLKAIIDGIAAENDKLAEYIDSH